MNSDARPKPDAPIDLPKIEGYRIEGMLGRGASGVVYSAVQEVIDRAVALKVLRADLAQSRRAVERFRREARTAARLAHPAIIAPIDMGQLPDGRWWYAMELVEGISLAERIEERGPLGEREALRMFTPLADALQHLHEVGVVHRDVKPANVLIDPRERALLADLGLAFARDEPSLTGSGGVLGTPHYVSPEQARDSSKVDVRSDIWSLGATLYHAVTGRPPFGGTSVAEVFSAVLSAPLVDPRRYAPDLSPQMVLVLRACLTRDLAHRYAEPKLLKADLQLLLERRPPKISKEGLEPLAQTKSWPRPALALAGIALALGALLFWSPWSSEAGGDLASNSPLAPLEALENNYQQGRQLPVAMWQRIQTWDVPSDASHRSSVERRLATLNIQVVGDISERLRTLASDVDAQIDGAFRVGSWLEASRLVRVEMPRRLLQELGSPTPSDLPDLEEVIGFRQWADGLEARLQAELERLLVQFEREAEDWVKYVVSPRVRTALQSNQFLASHSACTLSEAEALDALRGHWSGLPQEQVRERLSANVMGQLVPLQDLVSEQWQAIETQWQSEIDQQEVVLLRRIEDTLMEGMDGELQTQFERKGEELSVDLAQVPPAWSASLLQKLSQSKLRLRREGQDRRVAVARNEYVRDSADTIHLLARRQYAEVAQLWQDRLDSPWRVSVFPAMQRDWREAELLEGLLGRAAQTLKKREGETATLVIRGVPRDVVIRGSQDPLARGIDVESRGQVRTLKLRRAAQGPPGGDVLLWEDVLRLAGPGPIEPDGGEPGSPEQTRIAADAVLARALFLFHEGQLREAQAVLVSGQTYQDPMAALLRDRILQALTEGEGRSSEELRVEIAALSKDVRSGGQALDRWRSEIQTLLREPGITSAQRAQLMGMQRELRRKPKPRTLRTLYPDAELVHASAERAAQRDVGLRWRFDRNPDSWSLGGFTAEPGILRHRNSNPPGERGAWWEESLSLPLSYPLVLGRPMSFSLEFRIPEGDLPEPMVLTVGGVNIAFAPKPTDSRFAIGFGAPQSLLDSLRTSPTEHEAFAGFEPGTYHRIRIELSTLSPTRAGRLKAIRLDDTLLKGPTQLPRPATSSVLGISARGALDLYVVELEGTEALAR